ncbi:MAG: hypothetical protein AB8B64_05020 [Granulosicoccus sp.]
MNSMPLIVHFSDPADALEAERLLIDEFKNPYVNYRIAWWTTSQSLIAPRSLQRKHDINDAMALSAYHNWPVYFRQTGGDVTPQGSGVLNVAVAFALDPLERPSISGIYQLFCTPMIQWLKEHGCNAQTGLVPGSFCDGEYNIVVNRRKVAGTAQRWARVRAKESRQIVFVHALILLNADLDIGVSAINRFYESCSLERSVKSHRHTNFMDVLDPPAIYSQEAFAESLNERYKYELDALTS